MSPEVDASSPIIDTSRPIVVDMSQDLSAVLWNGLGVSGDECGIGCRIVQEPFRSKTYRFAAARLPADFQALAVGGLVYFQGKQVDVVALDPYADLVSIRDINSSGHGSGEAFFVNVAALRKPSYADCQALMRLRRGDVRPFRTP